MEEKTIWTGRFRSTLFRSDQIVELPDVGDAVSSSKGVLLRAGIIAVEKDPPHACRLYWLDEDSLDRAREEYIGWLSRVKECTESGSWPGPEPVETELAAPAWAVIDNEAVDFDGVEE